MSWYRLFRMEMRKAYQQIYLVNALGIMHVYFIIQDDTQQRRNS